MDRAHQTIVQFVGAGSIEQQAELIRHPERCLPLMQDWYAKRSFQPGRVGHFEMMATCTLNQLPFWVSLVMLEDGRAASLLLEDTPDGFKVDWEAYVGYNENTLGQFLTGSSNDTTKLRVYVTPTNYHHADFPYDQYACFRIQCRDESQSIIAFSRRDQRHTDGILTLTQEKTRVPLHLGLRIVSASGGEPFAEIQEMLATNWLALK